MLVLMFMLMLILICDQWDFGFPTVTHWCSVVTVRKDVSAASKNGMERNTIQLEFINYRRGTGLLLAMPGLPDKTIDIDTWHFWFAGIKGKLPARKFDIANGTHPSTDIARFCVIRSRVVSSASLNRYYYRECLL